MNEQLLVASSPPPVSFGTRLLPRAKSATAHGTRSMERSVVVEANIKRTAQSHEYFSPLKIMERHKEAPKQRFLPPGRVSKTSSVQQYDDVPSENVSDNADLSILSVHSAGLRSQSQMRIEAALQHIQEVMAANPPRAEVRRRPMTATVTVTIPTAPDPSFTAPEQQYEQLELHAEPQRVSYSRAQQAKPHLLSRNVPSAPEVMRIRPPSGCGPAPPTSPISPKQYDMPLPPHSSDERPHTSPTASSTPTKQRVTVASQPRIRPKSNTTSQMNATSSPDKRPNSAFVRSSRPQMVSTDEPFPFDNEIPLKLFAPQPAGPWLQRLKVC